MDFNTIEDVIASNLSRGFKVFINGKSFPFIKDLLFNVSFKINKKIIASYLILDEITGRGYAGSTRNVRVRLNQHRSGIITRTHENFNLKNILDYTNKNYITVIVIFTDSREESLDIEQKIIDWLVSNEKSMNISTDSRNNLSGLSSEARLEQIKKSSAYWLGRRHTNETKSKISQAHKGRVFSAETVQKMKEVGSNPALKTTRLQNLKTHVDKCKRKVLINNTEYSSINEAAKALGVNSTTINYRLNSKSELFSSYKYRG